MLVKIIYVLLFAIFNFVIYSKLNKTGKVSSGLFWPTVSIFVLFVTLHIGMLNWSFLLPWKDFFPLVIVLFAPVLAYLWFNYLAFKRIKRLNMSNEEFRNTAIRIFSFFFLKFFYVIAFIAQCAFIFHPISSIR
jgi:hypothetical protein